MIPPHVKGHRPHSSNSSTKKFPNVSTWLEWILVVSCLCQTSPVAKAGYVEQYLNSPEICPPAGKIPRIGFLFKAKLHLSKFPNNTAVVKLSRWQEKNPISAHMGFRCTFQVTAPKNHGVMMTVRSLNLRRYPHQPSCIDYIKFKPDKKPFFSPHVCGEVDVTDKSAEPNGMVGPRFIYDPLSRLDVAVLTEEASPNDPPNQKPLQIELVFTATRACSIQALRSGKLKQCTIKTPNSCIPSELFCDDYVNCGIEGDFGGDEMECTDKPAGVSKAMSIFIFGMTALGTLVTGAVLILLVCCCCRRFTKRSTSRTSSDAEQQVDLDLNRVETGSALRRPSTPTAPPEVPELPDWRTAKAESGDEDLPPSYKDLFPSSGTIIR